MRRLIVEPPLPMEEASAWATAEERAAAARFAPARAAEYLGWRAIVRRELGSGTAIAYDAVGAPVLPDLPYFLSVSHCRTHLAVTLSERRCAVDIERFDRNFGRIAHRYLTPAEVQLGAGDPRFGAVAWCAKEALYKYAGVRGCDLARDLRIDTIDFPAAAEATEAAVETTGTIRAHCEGVARQGVAEAARRELALSFRCTEDYAVVFLLE